MDNKNFYTAIVYDCTSVLPVEYIPKEILSVVDEQPIVSEVQINFWKWMAEYYMCTLGEGDAGCIALL